MDFIYYVKIDGLQYRYRLLNHSQSQVNGTDSLDYTGSVYNPYDNDVFVSFCVYMQKVFAFLLAISEINHEII